MVNGYSGLLSGAAFFAAGVKLFWQLVDEAVAGYDCRSIFK